MCAGCAGVVGVAAVSLLLWAGHAATQVYKWTDKDGRVHYGAHPPAEAKPAAGGKPAANAKPLAIALSQSANPSAGVEVPASKIQHYPVMGDTVHALHTSMMQNGPFNQIVQRRVYAEIEWRYRWKFDVAHEAGKCRLTRFNITLDTTITMPQWINAQSAPAALQLLWPRVVAKIRKHEDGHKAIGVEGANMLARRLQALPVFDTCDALTQVVNREGERVYAEYAQANSAFDRAEALKDSPFDE